MKLNIPATYSSITLGHFVKVMTAKSYIDKACAITGESKKVIRDLPQETVDHIINVWEQVVSRKTVKHTPTFKVSLFEKSLGLIPDFTAMTLGADIDARTYADNIWGGDSEKPNYHDLPKLIALLFRPVTYKVGQYYEIEPYDPDKVRHQNLVNRITMDRVEGALLFFSTIAKELTPTLQQYLLNQAEKEMKEAKEMLQKMQEEED